MRQHPAEIISRNLLQKLASSVYIIIILSKFPVEIRTLIITKRNFGDPAARERLGTLAYFQDLL
ncbi:MAG: hypothetical protein A2Y67_03325 [Candidatus Buchananbacteria bacterium RBG_13_39_9]|uniref:Uncharacterized protein n=1 Tax=Candidatus Buchananbacteria bacterium RBG_13_39_9 TaxID=1797531 RepID=A0A1G1XSF7_9BACT|nr:MAG: hypothetical protein A2Y67_03325 [Candidatus Buchananbacteria bacterium RBG_13_39_9]